jgi:hypothetical protein
MATSNVRVKLDVAKGYNAKGRKGKTKKKGKGIKETNRQLAQEQESKSARELQAEQAKKQGRDQKEIQRIRGRRVKKPASRAKAVKINQGPKIVNVSKSKKGRSLFGSKGPKKTTTKKSKNSSTGSKKSVAKSKPREYSQTPAAIRKRAWRAKQKGQSEGQSNRTNSSRRKK